MSDMSHYISKAPVSPSNSALWHALQLIRHTLSPSTSYLLIFLSSISAALVSSSALSPVIWPAAAVVVVIVDTRLEGREGL